MFDAFDRTDPGRQLPHHRFTFTDRLSVREVRATYRLLRATGFTPSAARAMVVRGLLHNPTAVFV